MGQFEYRVVPAPARPARGKGDGETRFAETVAAALNAEAREGWEYLRAETLPATERQGLTGSRTVFRTMLVFRRPAEPGEDEATRAAMKLLEHRSDTPARPAPPLTATRSPPPATGAAIDRDGPAPEPSPAAPGDPGEPAATDGPPKPPAG